MSIRTDDLGFVFYEADEQEEKELEYVYAITDSWNYMGDEVIDTFPRRFWDRVCQEKIKAPFTKEMFLQETDIIATIKGFGLDVNKFWWLCCLFMIGRLKSLPNVFGLNSRQNH